MVIKTKLQYARLTALDVLDTARDAKLSQRANFERVQDPQAFSMLPDGRVRMPVSGAGVNRTTAYSASAFGRSRHPARWTKGRARWRPNI